MRAKNRFYGLIVLLTGIVLASCEVNGFKTPPPAGKQLSAFPASMQGEWTSDFTTELFYVTDFSCNGASIDYEMGTISPGTVSTLELEKDSLELRQGKKEYYLSIAGPDFWINYVLRQPNKDEIQVYSFSDETKKHVKKYSQNGDAGEEGYTYTIFEPTAAEWKKLLKSDALKHIQTFHRKQ